MIDIYTMSGEAANDYSPINEQVSFYAHAYEVDITPECTPFNWGSSHPTLLAEWYEYRNLQNLIIQLYHDKNLSRPDGIEDFQWDYAFRMPVQLEHEDIRAIESANRSREFPMMEWSEATEELEYATNLAFVQKAYETLEAGKAVYYFAYVVK